MHKLIDYRIWGLFTIWLMCVLGPRLSWAQCVDQGKVWTKSWTSCLQSPNPNPAYGQSHWLLYEFTEPQNIDTTHIWNANRAGESDMGIKTAEIDYSVDGTTWLHLGTYAFPQANEQPSYAGFEGPVFGGIFIKKILITVIETYGAGSCASLSEVQFDINEGACYGELDACGVCNGEGETLWYIDVDADGLGSPNVVLSDCQQPAGYVDNADDPCDNGMSGWAEVFQIFSTNGCTGCHGMGAAGGLNLTSYETAVLGGNKCGPDILNGTTLADIIMVDNYAGCSAPIGFPSMNARTGGNIDSAELAAIQDWINAGAPYDCNCVIGAPDADGDGTCDYTDSCPSLDNALIGTPCDDGSSCTINDVWTTACTCEGQPKTDSDQDGICDDNDLAPSNPCTADGVIDGLEPIGWVANGNNDCDNDLVNIAGGDLNDFEPCVGPSGSLNTADCICGASVQPTGATLAYSVGINNPQRAEGLPDGSHCGYLYGSDTLILDLPFVNEGEEICVSTEYSGSPNGGIRVDVNGYLFTLVGDNALMQQQICFEVQESGIQQLIITENDLGGIRIDGVTVDYCACMDSTLANPTPLTTYAFTQQTGWQTVNEDELVVCEGDSLVLRMGNNPSQMFDWTGPNLGAVNASDLIVGTVQASTAGLYTVAYQNSYGCIIRKDIRVSVEEAPNVTVQHVNPTCTSPYSGAITFSFANSPQHTSIEFSMNGPSGPYQQTEDNLGLFSFADLGAGDYDLWVRWSADHCPMQVGEAKLRSGCDGVAIIAWLQGPYTGDSMAANLTGQLPLTDPYLGTVTATSLPANIVDWVLLEVRDSTDITNVLARRAYLLRSDGQVVDTAGDSTLILGNNLPPRAYVAIRHRNHLGIISATPIDMFGLIDFGDPSIPMAGTESREIQGLYALLRSGDANGDGSVNAVDQNIEWRPRVGQPFSYSQGGADVNLDGVINADDRDSHWKVNNGRWSVLPD